MKASLAFDPETARHAFDAVTTGQVRRTVTFRDPLPTDSSDFISPWALSPLVGLV